jgi:hypothetical protein
LKDLFGRNSEPKYENGVIQAFSHYLAKKSPTSISWTLVSGAHVYDAIAHSQYLPKKNGKYTIIEFKKNPEKVAADDEDPFDPQKIEKIDLVICWDYVESANLPSGYDTENRLDPGADPDYYPNLKKIFPFDSLTRIKKSTYPDKDNKWTVIFPLKYIYDEELKKAK